MFINNNFIVPSKSVKLLGITIDSDLKFDLHINNICKQANSKLRCLHRIRKFVKIDSAHPLCNAFVLSNFNYCPLIWMFCSKTLDCKINKIHKRAFRAVMGTWDGSLDELLNSTNGHKIHQRNIQVLLIEIFKLLLSAASPDLNRDLFVPKTPNYSLRTSLLLKLPETRTLR